MSGLKAVDRVLGPIVWIAAALLVLMLFIGPQVVANDKPTAANSAVYAQSLFSDNCGTCHTLSAAGTSGATGPNLDGLGLSSSAVAAQIKSGGGGMPSFAGQLDDTQIQAIANYVAANSGG